MNEDGKEDFESVAPEHWLSWVSRLWLNAKRLLWEEHVTDEDRRDAHGNARCRED